MCVFLSLPFQLLGSLVVIHFIYTKRKYKISIYQKKNIMYFVYIDIGFIYSFFLEQHNYIKAENSPSEPNDFSS